jgi:hypothetical protein
MALIQIEYYRVGCSCGFSAKKLPRHRKADKLNPRRGNETLILYNVQLRVSVLYVSYVVGNEHIASVINYGITPRKEFRYYCIGSSSLPTGL